MNPERKYRTSQQVLAAMIWTALLLILLFGAKSNMAVAQNMESSARKLTLTAAVDLALKQNLEIQIANIETASKTAGSGNRTVCAASAGGLRRERCGHAL